MMKPIILGLITGSLVLANPAHAQNAQAIDGDSLRLEGREIRLWGIDAPEYHQRCKANNKSYQCGGDAAQALRELVNGKVISCETKYRDKYGREVATCTTDGKDIAKQMVSGGWAIDYTRYSKGYYAQAESKAREEKRGLWSGNFEPPEQWRMEHKR